MPEGFPGSYQPDEQPAEPGEIPPEHQAWIEHALEQDAREAKEYRDALTAELDEPGPAELDAQPDKQPPDHDSSS
jgi:hypothetical protein